MEKGKALGSNEIFADEIEVGEELKVTAIDTEGEEHEVELDLQEEELEEEEHEVELDLQEGELEEEEYEVDLDLQEEELEEEEHEADLDLQEEELEGEEHEADLDLQEDDLEGEESEVTEDESQEQFDSQDSDGDFTLDELIPVKTKAISKVVGDPGVLSIIKSDNGGKRITFAKNIMEKLNNPVKLQVALARKGIVVGEQIPNKTGHFPVKKSGAKGVIYSGGLVEEIAKEYNLDFSNRVSITFQKVVYKSMDGQTLAFFKLVE